MVFRFISRCTFSKSILSICFIQGRIKPTLMCLVYTAHELEERDDFCAYIFNRNINKKFACKVTILHATF